MSRGSCLTAGMLLLRLSMQLCEVVATQHIALGVSWSDLRQLHCFLSRNKAGDAKQRQAERLT